ncbi:homoserine kinase [Neobittarella massiliensis]|uniref:Homoserine kinase n=2 Tax=Oscillospiraceae TaxID=216572 RepID=A0A8J6IIN8_9FIRM|nr:homoserine kinase [Neobittarella massiliensis]MBC3515156.1 homoserine kinase [Neobittarella massiliensis]SCJ63499.1 Homoserine kinase [uncultured Anaerotruncus sp.]
MIKVTVPATSANIGAGFDSLGLALGMHNTIYLKEAQGPDIASLDGVRVPTGEKNLIYQTVKDLYNRCGRSFPGLYIRQQNTIPMTRGLGSSSACIVGGLLGGNALLGQPFTTDELVDMAAHMEGHPDNSTPAILGGFVAAVLEDEHVFYVKKDLDSSLHFVAFIPDFALKTEEARAALPATVSHKDAVYNLSRAALMATSICTGKLDNIRVAAGDRLHQPYRLGLIPGGDGIFDAAYSEGALAVFVSGAGPTILALVDGGDTGFCQRVQARISQNEQTARFALTRLTPDNRGAYVQQLDDTFLPAAE